MGQHMSKNDRMFTTMIEKMLATRGFKVSEKIIWDFVNFIKTVSPWFLEEGSMTLSDWKQIGKEMRRYVQSKGESTLPAHAFALWLQIRGILTETTEFEGLLQETSSQISGPSYDEVQEAKEITVGTQKYGSVNQNPATAPVTPMPVALAARVRSEWDNDWDLDDEAARYHDDEYRDHHHDQVEPVGMTYEPMKCRTRKVGAMPPVGFRGAMVEAQHTGDLTFAFPVMEARDDDDDEPQWELLSLKTLKELQAAVKNSGATAPYTLQVLDVVASSWLTPYDWMQTAKATLSAGDYILWRTEYEDLSKESIIQSQK